MGPFVLSVVCGLAPCNWLSQEASLSPALPGGLGRPRARRRVLPHPLLVLSPWWPWPGFSIADSCLFLLYSQLQPFTLATHLKLRLPSTQPLGTC